MTLDKRVVVTGGSSGLGLEVATMLAKQGCKLALIARNVTTLEEAKTHIVTTVPNANVHIYSVDVSEQAKLNQIFANINQDLGGIDVLINSAGILEEGYFENLTTDIFRRVMDVNFFGVLNSIKAALPFLKQVKGGRIINVASIAGLAASFGYTAYCASKHALVGFTKTLAIELAPQGITVQMVCPGEFDSPMVEKLNESRTPENKMYTLLIPKTPVEDVAQAVVNCLSHTRLRTIPNPIAAAMVFGLEVFPRISAMFERYKLKKVYVGPEKQ